jgi:hypothetical protein
MTRSTASRIAGTALLAAVCATLLLTLADHAGAAAVSRLTRSSVRAPTTGCAAATSRQARACEPSRRHRGKHAHNSHRRRHTHHKGTGEGTGTITTRLSPICEDDSKAISTAGTSTCDDGSEPQCALNTTPVLRADGEILYCTPDTLPGEEECGNEGSPACGSFASSGAPACDDGTDAPLSAEGVYGCDDGTEPRCDEGLALSISEDGSSLVCEPANVEAGDGPDGEAD